MELIVHESPAEASAATAHRIADDIRSSKDRFSLGLAGGTTPAATYEILRHVDISWVDVDGWLPDERWVPYESELNNGRMVLDALFSHVEAVLHRPPWTPETPPEEAAAQYESDLSSILGGGPDLVFLGMGDDGHTASLFPGSTALDEDERLYVANTMPATGETRLTATYPLLHSARTTIFLAFGANKAQALLDSLEGNTPAGRIGEGKGEVIWHVDRSAASLLS